LCARDAGDRIEQEKHAEPVVTKALRNRGGDVRRAKSLDGRGVARGGHHDGALPSHGAQRSLEKLRDLAPALADQSHDDHVCHRAARHRAEQGALAHPRSGKEPDALPDPEREQTVDGAHAGRERLAHGPALERTRRLAVHGDEPKASRRIEAVERPTEAIEHPTDQRGPDSDLQATAQRLDRVTRADTGKLAQRERHGFGLREAHDLRRKLDPATPHDDEVANSDPRHANPNE
jgi:hypothetical protein